MGTDHVIIAHGKSEVLLFWGLFTRFDIDANIFSLENGERGIPMSHLPQVLSERPFITERMLADRWRGLDYRSGHIPGLGIFPVADHDDDDRNLRGYISGDLLRGCPLHDRVVPIVNRPDLNSVMERIGYGRPRDKVEFYHGLVGHGCDVMGMYDRFRGCSDTNLDVLIHRLLSSSPGFQNRMEAPTGLF